MNWIFVFQINQKWEWEWGLFFFFGKGRLEYRPCRVIVPISSSIAPGGVSQSGYTQESYLPKRRVPGAD
jgi:hypothetical protein